MTCVEAGQPQGFKDRDGLHLVRRFLETQVPRCPKAAEVPGVAALDVSSGVETNKVKDFWKIRVVVRLAKRQLPSYFGPFGGQFVPEILIRAMLTGLHPPKGKAASLSSLSSPYY
jgi:hypothetical protein